MNRALGFTWGFSIVIRIMEHQLGHELKNGMKDGMQSLIMLGMYGHYVQLPTKQNRGVLVYNAMTI